MHLRRSGCFLGIFLLAAPALAAENCVPGTVEAAIDRYAAEPFGARNWRVLKGLGDPMIDPTSDAMSDWEAGDQFRKLAAGVASDVPLPSYFGYECRLGYPLQVLKKRVADLGKDNPYVKQWLRSQAVVIAACGGEQVDGLPAPIELTGDIQSLQAADRAYQDASIAFYRDKARALELYKAIGASNSPHRAAARYNVANLLANAKRLDEARTEAKAILADPSLASVHEITQQLLGYIANQEDTAQSWSDLIDGTIAVLETPEAQIAASDKLKADYGRALYDIDFAGVRAKDDDWWLNGNLPENPTLSKAIYDASRKHAMVGWMIAGQTAQGYFDRLPWQMAGQKWQDRTRSLVDRTMALGLAMPEPARDALDAMKAAPGSPSLWPKAEAAGKAAVESCGKAPETAAAGLLLQQATRLSTQAGAIDEALTRLEAYPAKDSAAYRQAVLRFGQYLLGQGMVAEGRKLRDRLLTDAFWTGLPRDDTESRNGFAELAMWLAEDRAQWDAALARHTAKTDVALLNFLPARELRRMAADDKLFSPNERALLIRAAWTRDFARKAKPDAAFTKEMLALNPDIQRVVDEVEKQDGKRDWTLILLRAPAFGILLNAPADWTTLSMAGQREATALDAWDKNDKNWWCPFETDRLLIALREEADAAAGQATTPWAENADKAVYDQTVRDGLVAKREAVLKEHPVVKTIGWKEIAALQSMPSAPKRLTESALAWAKTARKDDKGIAEALALAVRATRYGCSWHGGHGAYSKQAQTLLQTKYPDTTWAKETPYWFDCMERTTDAAGVLEPTCAVRAWPKQDLPR